jgi:hypothetical protein
MEEINFINTQDLKKNHRLKKYVRLSIVLAIAIIIVLTVITLRLKNKLNAIKANLKKNEIKVTSPSKSGEPNKPNGPNETLEQKTKLKNEKTELKKQLSKINNLKKTPKKQTSIVLNIYNIISKQIEPQTITVNKNEFIILAESTDDKIANKITKQLSKLQYIKTANLASIAKNNNKFVFQIKGEIKV